jgi:hypothetical protein
MTTSFTMTSNKPPLTMTRSTSNKPFTSEKEFLRVSKSKGDTTTAITDEDLPLDDNDIILQLVEDAILRRKAEGITIQNLRKEMMVIKKLPPASPGGQAAVLTQHRKRDPLGGGSWHGPSSTSKYITTAAPIISKQQAISTINREEQGTKNIDTIGGASKNAIPGLATAARQKNPMTELQLLIAGNDPATTPSTTTTTTTTTNPRPTRSKDSLGQTWRGGGGAAAPATGKILGKEELRRKAAANLLSTSSHEPQDKQQRHSDPLRSSRHNPISRSRNNNDPLRSSRHGAPPPVPRRHKSVQEQALEVMMEPAKQSLTRSRSTEREQKKQQQQHDPLRSSQHHRPHHRSRTNSPHHRSRTNKEHSPDTTTTAGEEKHKKACEKDTSTTSSSQGADDDDNEEHSNNHHSRRLRSREAGGGGGDAPTTKITSEALTDRCTRTAEKLRNRSSSRGRKKSSAESGETERKHRKSSRSASGERRRRRVKSCDRTTKRRQLKGGGGKQITMAEDDIPNNEEGKFSDILKEENEISENEKNEILMMDFSKMSFDCEWDVKPMSMRPSLDTARALDAVESGKLRRKLKTSKTLGSIEET